MSNILAIHLPLIEDGRLFATNALNNLTKRQYRKQKKHINKTIDSMDKTLIDMIIRKMNHFTDNELLNKVQKEMPYKKALQENTHLNLYDMYSYFSRKR